MIWCSLAEVDGIRLLRSTHHILTVWQGKRPVRRRYKEGKYGKENGLLTGQANQAAREYLGRDWIARSSSRLPCLRNAYLSVFWKNYWSFRSFLAMTVVRMDSPASPLTAHCFGRSLCQTSLLLRTYHILTVWQGERPIRWGYQTILLPKVVNFRSYQASFQHADITFALWLINAIASVKSIKLWQCKLGVVSAKALSAANVKVIKTLYMYIDNIRKAKASI